MSKSSVRTSGRTAARTSDNASSRPSSASSGKAGLAVAPPRPCVLPASNKVITELSTLRDCLRYAVSRFGQADIFCGHGLPDVYDEAVYLAQWALHLPLDRLEPFLDAALSRDERASVLALIDARCQRIPSFYLTGQAWLAGSKFICDKRALVPRSLIAEALSGSLSDWIESAPTRVLDLCTGGGSIAILAALHWPKCTVLASDISAPALQLADENIRMHQLRLRVTTCQSDLMASIAPTEFDLILCNPPYVNAQAMARLPAEFLAEPHGALAGGEDGMDLIRTILTQARGALTEHGAVLLEIGHEAEHFEQAFPTMEFSYLPVTQGEQMLVWVTREQLLAGLHKPTLVDSSKRRAAKPPTSVA